MWCNFIFQGIELFFRKIIKNKIFRTKKLSFVVIDTNPHAVKVFANMADDIFDAIVSGVAPLSPYPKYPKVKHEFVMYY